MEKGNTFFRTLIDITVFVCILVFPWWLSVIIVVSLTIYFPFYLEVLFFGFIFDTLYGQNHTGLIIATIFLASVMFARTRIRT
jgi:hypothetical protein